MRCVSIRTQTDCPPGIRIQIDVEFAWLASVDRNFPQLIVVILMIHFHDQNGMVIGSPANGVQQARWCPHRKMDGKDLAYAACGRLGGGPCSIFIRSVESGQVRELPARMDYFDFLQWSPDGNALLISGAEAGGKNPGTLQIGTRTGEVSRLLDAKPYPQWWASCKAGKFLTSHSSNPATRFHAERVGGR
jgi:hypothetical protein